MTVAVCVVSAVSFFFFSSRRRHTRCYRDWSSDVCSSDLDLTGPVVVGKIGDDLRMDYTAVGDTTNLAARMQQTARPGSVVVTEATHKLIRSEERRVGKECKARWSEARQKQDISLREHEVE